jgi:hypothetical protein
VPNIVVDLTIHADRHDELTDISWQLLVLNAPELLLRIFTCFRFIKKPNIKNRNELNESDVLIVTQEQWRTQEFFSGGVQQIQLTEGREKGDLGALAP